MSKQPESIQSRLDADKILDDLATLNGIDIPQVYRQSVVAHLQTAARMADLVYSVDMDIDAFELAPVYTPDEVAADSKQRGSE